MAEGDEEEKEEEEEEADEEEEVLKCSECEAMYESTPDTRRIVNKLGHFVCPKCLTDRYAEQEGKKKTPKAPAAPPAPPAAPAAPAAPAPKPKK